MLEMSLRDCIGRGVAGGEMDPARAQRILDQYDNAFAEFQQSMGHTQAELAAARRVVDAARTEAAEKRRVTQLQAAAHKRNMERLQQHRDVFGKAAPWAFPGALITNKRGSRGETLDGKYQAVRREFRRQVTGMTEKFRANLLGSRRNAESLKNMVREVFGEATGDTDAAGFARAWAQVAETARTRRNAAGGHTGKRDDWGLPQMHDADRVRKATFDDWEAFILPRLDLNKMGREFNDGVPFTRETIMPILQDSYETIRSNGASKLEPSGRRGAAMYNQKADPRFFAFKDANSWMEYNDRFGSGNDPFRVMMGHLDAMAHDIAMMEVLGPNPAFAFQVMLDAGSIAAGRSAQTDAMSLAGPSLKVGKDLFDRFNGTTNMPVNAKWAGRLSAVRNYLTSAHLGSAILSQITDMNHARLASKFVGMSQAGSFRQIGRLLRSKELRAEAADAGLIFENAVDIGNAVARYELEQIHTEVAARMGDFTIRASGMGFVTEVQRQAFGLHFMNTAAKDWVTKPMSDLDPRTARVMQNFGITAREWDAIRETPIHTQSDGLRLLRASDIAERVNQTVADRYMEMIVSQIEMAVPSTDLYGRTLVLGSTQPGTIIGETARFGMQFKSFPITLMVTQFGRIMQEAVEGRKANALTYAAGLVLGNTVLGAIAYQLKEMSKGKDPRPMNTPEFWMAAGLQGGGAGIFGDFLFADVNRYGSSVAQTLAGPGVGFAQDMIKLSVGNVQQAALGDDMDLGADLVQMLRRYTPGGSLWYARLAYEREVLDQLQSVVDPSAARKFRARMRTANRDGTDYFAPPGSSVIQGQGSTRAPDISNAFGG